MLMPASDPQPHRKSPAATMYTLTEKATMIVPSTVIAQLTRIEFLLPKLSEKNEITIYPMNAPK